MEQHNLIGRTIDKYEILDEIARGGMATVYKARQQTVNRTVAVKVIDAEYAKDPTLMQRFRREVDLIATLQHPHILPVYDYGQVDGRPYIVMAYMPGGSAHELIVAPGHMKLETISRILTQTADALDHAHRENVIHRDLKPSNILMDKNNNAHLADFGIAKLLAEETEGLTGDRIIGTLSYMAPEMFRKQDLTPAIDIYALGVTLYQMLAEETPYKGDTAQVIGAHLHEPIPSVRHKRPDLPEGLDLVIRRAMAKYPEDRYPTAGEMAADFQAVLRGEKIGADKLGGTVSTERVPKIERPPTPPKQPIPSNAGDTLIEDQQQWHNPPQQPPPPPAYQQYPQQAYPPQPYYPEPSRGGGAASQGGRRRRREGGVPLGLLFGMVGLLLICVLAGVVALVWYFGGPQPSQVDSPASGNTDSGVAEMPTALPTPLPTDPPTPTNPGDPTAAATVAVEDEEAIRQAVLNFDEAMRLVLETGDTSTIGLYARGEARDKRIQAAEILASGPDAPCFWDYQHEGIDFFPLEPLSDTEVKVLANVHRSGTVICTDGEHDEYAFPGPYTAIYVAEFADGQWWVTQYCPYDNCPSELTGEEE